MSRLHSNSSPLQADLPFKIPECEIETRRDLREDCVFTIDGIGARDLDDGTYDIGVHITDVSHFVKFNALLDCDACKRATSAYLTQRAAPCSLLTRVRRFVV